MEEWTVVVKVAALTGESKKAWINQKNLTNDYGR